MVNARGESIFGGIQVENELFFLPENASMKRVFLGLLLILRGAFFGFSKRRGLLLTKVADRKQTSRPRDQ